MSSAAASQPLLPGGFTPRLFKGDLPDLEVSQDIQGIEIKIGSDEQVVNLTGSGAATQRLKNQLLQIFAENKTGYSPVQVKLNLENVQGFDNVGLKLLGDLARFTSGVKIEFINASELVAQKLKQNPALKVSA